MNNGINQNEEMQVAENQRFCIEVPEWKLRRALSMLLGNSKSDQQKVDFVNDLVGGKYVLANIESGELVDIIVQSSDQMRAEQQASFENSADFDLYESLRAVRYKLAKENGVMSYVIMTNQCLRDMAISKPKNLDDLLEIYGIGERKAANYGAPFIEAIEEFVTCGKVYTMPERK